MVNKAILSFAPGFGARPTLQSRMFVGYGNDLA